MEIKQKELTGALIGLAHAVESAGYLPDYAAQALIAGLRTLPETDDTALTAQVGQIHQAKSRLTPMCASCASPCGKNNDFDMDRLQQNTAEVRAMKEQLLQTIGAMAVRESAGQNAMFFCECLCKISTEDTADEMQSLLSRAAITSSKSPQNP